MRTGIRERSAKSLQDNNTVTRVLCLKVDRLYLAC